MSKNIDNEFAKQPEDIRLSYLARALSWYADNGRGQPSLIKAKELAATFWNNDVEFLNHLKRKQK